MEPYAAVILAGGAARRLGGVDKPMLMVRGRPMLHRVLDAVPDATDRIVVGPPSLRLPAGVRRVREEPPGGGPVAATAAGLASLARVPGLATAPGPGLTPAPDLAIGPDLAPGPGPRPARGPGPGARPGPGTVDGDGPGGLAGGGSPGSGAGFPGVVALLAADLPFLDPAAILTLRTALAASPVDGVVFVDGDGRRQTLCGVWRTGPLRAALDRIGPPAGVPLRQLLAGLRVAEATAVGSGGARKSGGDGGGGDGGDEDGGRGAPAGAEVPPPWYDCDEPDDLHRAEEWPDVRT